MSPIETTKNKNMKLTKGLILIALAAVAFAGCKKEDDDDSPSQTKKEMLTSGSWIKTDVLLDGTSIWAMGDACSKDDFYTLKADGTGVTDEGPTKCDPADPQTTPVTWAFSSNETILTFDGDVSTIAELTNSSMILKSSEGGFNTEVRFKKK